MDTNRVEARFEDGITLAIDCIAVEDEYGNSPAQRAELDWLLYNKPLEYAQMVLRGRWSAISASAVTTAGWKIDCCLFQSNQAVLICFAVSLYAAFTVSSP